MFARAAAAKDSSTSDPPNRLYSTNEQIIQTDGWWAQEQMKDSLSDLHVTGRVGP